MIRWWGGRREGGQGSGGGGRGGGRADRFCLPFPSVLLFLKGTGWRQLLNIRSCINETFSLRLHNTRAGVCPDAREHTNSSYTTATIFGRRDSNFIYAITNTGKSDTIIHTYGLHFFMSH